MEKNQDPNIIYCGFLKAPLMALGPGIRVGLWVKGCPLSCPGCIAPELQKWEAKDVHEVSDIASQILSLYENCNATGVTISGGEPFFQKEALENLLKILRTEGVSDILVYSGYSHDKLGEDCPWLPTLVTALVDGPFEVERPTLETYKGSEGQVLYVFDSSQKKKYQRWSTQKNRTLQIDTLPDGIRIIGIPYIGDFFPPDSPRTKKKVPLP
ncbi:MAG: radical SAM protein [Deltaproteobacteria bacterium]|jgi:anaerobic ribonucleoside-triphosphate reductase activating protein|nr:radical SAM protein [Deltaproteobacteria bacterium]